MNRMDLVVLVGIGTALTGVAGCGSGGSAADMSALDMKAANTAPTCSDYCATIQANCTGDQQQYTDTPTCMADCAVFPLGKSTDATGNTLGCRTYHAGAAKADPKTHCQHAGPGGAGVCGANCDGLCQLALKWCVGPNQVYRDAADCMTRCAAFPDDAPVGAVTQDGYHRACLVWHAMEAGGGNPMDHCLGDIIGDADAGIKSMTCM
jgi:hypothetical protein